MHPCISNVLDVNWIGLWRKLCRQARVTKTVRLGNHFCMLRANKLQSTAPSCHLQPDICGSPSSPLRFGRYWSVLKFKNANGLLVAEHRTFDKERSGGSIYFLCYANRTRQRLGPLDFETRHPDNE